MSPQELDNIGKEKKLNFEGDSEIDEYFEPKID